MKYVFWILLFVAGFFTRGFFFQAPQDLKLENVSSHQVGAVDSITVDIIAQQDSVTAELRKRISELSFELLAAERRNSQVTNPSVVIVQERAAQEPEKVSENDIIREDFKLEESDEYATIFVSSKTFFPDDYITSRVIAYGPAPADSLGNDVTVDYNKYYQEQIQPELKTKWQWKDYAIVGGFGFVLGVLTIELVK